MTCRILLLNSVLTFVLVTVQMVSKAVHRSCLSFRAALHGIACARINCLHRAVRRRSCSVLKRRAMLLPPAFRVKSLYPGFLAFLFPGASTDVAQNGPSMTCTDLRPDPLGVRALGAL